MRNIFYYSILIKYFNEKQLIKRYFQHYSLYLMLSIRVKKYTNSVTFTYVNKVNVPFISCFSLTFIHRYDFLISSIGYTKNFLVITLNAKLLLGFFNNVSALLSNLFYRKKNVYIFSKTKSLNCMWRLNFTKLIFKNRPKWFKRVISYYFFKNNIHAIITIDFNLAKLLKILKKLKLIRVGFLVTRAKFEFYHNFLYLPTYNFFTKYYMYSFIMRIYISNLNSTSKLLTLRFLSNFKLFTHLNIN